MPGFSDILQQGYQYHEPVAPVVPKPDNTAAELISRGTQTLVQAAIARERAQLEQQQLIQHADLAAKQLAFDREHLATTYDLAKSAQELTHEKTILDFGAAEDRIKIEGDWHNWQKENSEKYFKTAFDRNLAFAKQNAKTIEEAGQVSDKLQLFDPEFQTKHPMQFAANLLGFKNIYGNAPDVTKIPATIARLQSIADKQKVALNVNGEKKEYPWWQVVDDIQRNKENSPFIPALRDAGMFQVSTGTEKIGGVDVPSTKREPKAMLKSMLEDAQTANFDAARKQVSRVKPFSPQTATDAIAAGTLVPGGGGTDTATPPPNPNGTAAGRLNAGAVLPDPVASDEQTHANYVKGLIDKSPDKSDELKAMFFQNFPNADPNTFDGAQ